MRTDDRCGRDRRRRQELDEVPIGACLIDENGELIASAFNRTIIDCDPTAHAEILALREAAATDRQLPPDRYDGLYDHRAVRHVCRSSRQCPGQTACFRRRRRTVRRGRNAFPALRQRSLNHRIEITSGVLADECRALMQDVFPQPPKRLERALMPDECKHEQSQRRTLDDAIDADMHVRVQSGQLDIFLHQILELTVRGEVREWLNRAVSKIAVP